MRGETANRTIDVVGSPVAEPEPNAGRSWDQLFLSPPTWDEAEPTPQRHQPASPDPVASTRRGPRRVPTVALLVVAVAAMVGVGALTDADGDERGLRQPSATTTTETQGRAAAAEATMTDGHRAASGPLLPELTGAILVVATRLQIGIVELDTGAVRSVELPGHGGYEIVSTTGDAAILRGPAGVFAVPVAAGEAPVLLADNRAGAWPVASDRPGHVWLVTHSVDALQAAEVSVKGQATGRQFVLSGSFGDPLLVGVNGGLAIGALGSLNHYDVDTGETTPVGHGHLLAGSGHTLARVSCEELRCRLHLTDVRTGHDVEMHERAETLVVATRPAAFSPDGRWLVVGAHTVRGTAVALVDVAERRIAAVHRSRIDNGYGTAVAFSADSRWLFQLDPAGDVLAHRLGTDETLVVEGVQPRHAIALAALATAAPPAG